MKANYVDNKKLFLEMVKYRKLCDEAKAISQPRPIIPNYIAVSIMNIAAGLAKSPKFRNYPHIEDMKGDGILTCVTYLHNFNPEKSNNPFAYFTQCIYFAFLQRITREKKHLVTKHKVYQNEYLFGALDVNNSEHESTNIYNTLDNEYMSELTQTFDNKLKKKRRQKEPQGIEVFVEKPYNEN